MVSQELPKGMAGKKHFLKVVALALVSKTISTHPPQLPPLELRFPNSLACKAALSVKAHAVLARPCALNWSRRRSAILANVLKRGVSY